MPSISFLFLPGLTGLLFLCGSLTGCQSDVCEPRQAENVDPLGTEYRYVVRAIELPNSASSAAALAMYIDGDELLDNRIGAVFSIISTYSEYDLSAEANALVAEGELLQLIDVQTQSFGDAAGVGVQVGLGIDLDGEPGNNHSGSEPLALDLEVQPGLMSGLVDQGELVVELGTAPLAVTFPGLGEHFLFHLRGARLEATMTEDGLEGRIGGAISLEDVTASMLPALTEGFARAINADCPQNVCVDGSFGALVVAVFDQSEPQDFVVSVAELQNNSLMDAVLKPDIDLMNAEGELAPNCDGIKESLSISVGFSAVRADIPR